MIKELGLGIKIMKFRRSKMTQRFLFADVDTCWGYVVLRLRGYYPHMTVFGKVLRKDFDD